MAEGMKQNKMSHLFLELRALAGCFFAGKLSPSGCLECVPGVRARRVLALIAWPECVHRVCALHIRPSQPPSCSDRSGLNRTREVLTYAAEAPLHPAPQPRHRHVLEDVLGRSWGVRSGEVLLEVDREGRSGVARSRELGPSEVSLRSGRSRLRSGGILHRQCKWYCVGTALSFLHLSCNGAALVLCWCLYSASVSRYE